MNLKDYENWSTPSEEYLEMLGVFMKRKKCILFDMDGPLCDLFAGLPAYTIATHMKTTLRWQGMLSEDILEEDDPHAIYKGSEPFWTNGKPSLFLDIEQTLTDYECRAARLAVPTHLYAEFVKYWVDTLGKLAAVTTNNSREAAKVFLERDGTLDYFGISETSESITKTEPNRKFGVYGRVGPNPVDLKPNPLYLQQAMYRLSVHPSECVMFGDTLTDWFAAQNAGVDFIGHTFTFKKCAKLLRAGAQFVISDYTWLFAAMAPELDYFPNTGSFSDVRYR